MDKKEFLSFSLPYGLKAIYTPLNEPDSIVEFGPSRYTMFVNKKYDYKPILRQLDLTKEIEHNGEKFVPIVKLGWAYDIIGWSKSNTILATKNLSLIDALKLISWHFDLFGGIDNGEAIDVNTLETNPYK